MWESFRDFHLVSPVFADQLALILNIFFIPVEMGLLSVHPRVLHGTSFPFPLLQAIVLLPSQSCDCEAVFLSRKAVSRSIPVNPGPIPVPIPRSVAEHIFLPTKKFLCYSGWYKAAVLNIFLNFLIMQNAAQ